MKILVIEPEEIHTDSLDLLKKGGHKVFLLNHKYKKNHIDAIFIRTNTHVTKKYILNFPNLKYILRAGVGLDNIDKDILDIKKIKIINSPGSNANSVAEFVIGMMFALCRNVKTQSLNLEKGQWRSRKYLGTEIKNKTIGIIGCGAIGRLIAKKIKSFDPKIILGFDPFLNKVQLNELGIKKINLKELIKKSDFITLHLPLNNDTRNLISKEELYMMKRSAYVINTSRGGIISEKHLINAVKKKYISGAALDVFENEPNINKNLLGFDNIILTPHLGAYTEEADRNMSIETVNNFLKITQ